MKLPESLAKAPSRSASSSKPTEASLPAWNEDSSSSLINRSFWQPPTSSTVKLMATGATVGTVVDSLHNQILLEYHVAPIQIPSLLNQDAYWLASSWTVPPLLAVAYLVLGGILPRLVQKAINTVQTKTGVGEQENDVAPTTASTEKPSSSVDFLRNRALWAVTTTALIVKLSDLLERSNVSWEVVGGASMIDTTELGYLIILFGAAFAQWWYLDRTLAAFLLAAVAAYGGPLAELPFVAANVWTYLPDAAHYLPLQADGPVALGLRTFLSLLFPGQGQQQDLAISDLAISYLSAPCYFAVTMDAIALGRWFDAQHEDGQKEKKASPARRGRDELSFLKSWP